MKTARPTIAPPSARPAILRQLLDQSRKRSRPLRPLPTPDRVRRHFQQHPDGGGLLDTSTPWYVEALSSSRLLSSAIARPGPLSVADVGCGRGGLLRWIRRRRESRPFAYAGFDLDPKTIEGNRRRFPGAEFRVLDVRRAGPDLRSDWCFLVNVLPYLSRPGPVLRRMARAASRLLVMDPVPSGYWDEDFGTFRVLLRSPEEIDRLLGAAGLKAIEEGFLYGLVAGASPLLPLSRWVVARPATSAE